MLVEEYIEIRESAKYLSQKIFAWGRGKFDYILAGKKLGLVNKGAFVLGVRQNSLSCFKDKERNKLY